MMKHKCNLIVLIILLVSNLTFSQDKHVINLPKNKSKEDIKFVLKNEICFVNSNYGFFIRKDDKKQFVLLENYKFKNKKEHLLFVKINYINNKCRIKKYYFRHKIYLTNNKKNK